MRVSINVCLCVSFFLGGGGYDMRRLDKGHLHFLRDEVALAIKKSTNDKIIMKIE